MKLILTATLAYLVLNVHCDEDPGTPLERRGKGKNKSTNKDSKRQKAVINQVINYFSDMETDDAHSAQLKKLFEDGIKKRIRDTPKNELKATEQALDALYASIDGSARNLNCAGPNCNVPLTLSGLFGYGCWCNLGADVLQGRGQPVNPHDSACERLQSCLRCAKMDGADGGYGCDPRSITYNAAFSINTNNAQLASSCLSQNNGDFCGAHVCTCEIQFINEILDLVFQQYVYDPAFAHPAIGGTFDADANCGNVLPGSGEIECCGGFPARYPYNINDKDCCAVDGIIFNPFEFVCCTNGVQSISNGGCN